MIKKLFRIDLGHGDSIDISVERNEGYTLKDFTNEIKSSDGWFEIGDTSIQVSHIKRIIEIL